MAVGKISVNTLNNQAFGANYPMQNPQQVVSQQPASNRDKSKVVAWSLAGLATAGLVGVLIYNARKGKVSGAAEDPLLGVGTYLRKYLDESIFANSIKKVQEGSTDLQMKMSSDGNDIQLGCQDFACQLVKKVPAESPDVANFSFDSIPLGIRIFNKDKDLAKFEFGLGYHRDVKLSIDIEPWRGQVKGHTLTDADGSYSFTEEQCHEIVDKLDLQKLIDDKNYRVSYIDSLMRVIGGTVRKTKFEKVAQKTGKTLEQVAEAHDSKEFDNLRAVHGALLGVHKDFVLSETPFESEILKATKGKDVFGMLEDFLMGGLERFKIADDVKLDKPYFPTEKPCFEYSVPTEDGKGVLEHLQFSNNLDYVLYEKINPENPAQTLRIETYLPELNENNSLRTSIDVGEVSFFDDMTKTGDSRVNISHPDRKETVNFTFNLKDAQPRDYTEELEPYKDYMEKLAAILAEDETRVNFLRDFIKRGKEALVDLTKNENA